MKQYRIRGGAPLQGAVTVPGDKSISHRAALLGAMAHGTTRIRGFLRGEDCLSTLRCLRAMGVAIEDDGATITVRGEGLASLREPAGALDVGNAGTLMRLLAGVVAGCPFPVTLDGDASIRRRPMDRIALPLERMGVRVSGQGERVLPPIRIEGGQLRPVEYVLPMASAQVKSCVLLAGCSAEGTTRTVEPAPTRDHTERMLAGFGARVTREGPVASVQGPAALRACEVEVPGDLSSAAFALVAGLVVAGSRVRVRNVGLNETRTGLLDALRAMGAEITESDAGVTGGEPVGDLTVSESALGAGEASGALIARAIDEIPLLALAGCFASGPLVVSDAAELRVKESDRIAAIAETLEGFGARVDVREDGFTVHPSALRAATVESRGDHRIAMTATVAGLACEGETVVRDTECVDTSFPGFVALLRTLGARIEEESL